MSNNVELNDNNSLTAQFNAMDKNKELTDDEFEELQSIILSSGRAPNGRYYFDFTRTTIIIRRC